MPIPLELIVFGVQSIVKLGTAVEQAYEQWIRDADATLPVLPANWQDDIARAVQFFKLPEMRIHVGPGSELAAHWDSTEDRAGPLPGLAHSDAVVARWRALLATGGEPRTLPRDVGRAGGVLVRQWGVGDPGAPPPPYLRIVLALGDVALDFAQASPTLLASSGASQKLLEAVAAVATETRGVLPDLEDPDAWKGDNWVGANFAQSLLVAAFRAGLGALADHPDLLVDQQHVQHLITAVLTPLRDGFDAEAKKPGATSADVLRALVKWERLRDTILPGMVAGAIKAVAADRNAFFGNFLKADGQQLHDLVAALAGAVLDQTAGLDAGNLLQQQTWIDFFRAAVSVIASRPELVVAGADSESRKKALRDLVAAVAGRIGDDLKGGGVTGTVLLDVATAALDSAHASLPLLLGPAGTWDGVAADLAGAVIDAVRPALAAGNPALLSRLASRDAIVQLVDVVVRNVAATPALVACGHARQEVQAVVAAVASAMLAKGADLLHPAGWLAVAAAAAEAAAANPGRLFRLPEGGDAGIGARLIGVALAQAGNSLAAAADGRPPPIAGPVLQEVITDLLMLAAKRRLTPQQVDDIATVLATLATEAAKSDGQIMPAGIVGLLVDAVEPLLAGKLAANANIGGLLAAIGHSA